MFKEMKLFAKSVVAQFGFEVRRLNRDYTIAGLLRREKIDLVIDVGANEGQYASMLRYSGYTGGIMSFEPNPDAYQILEARMRGDSAWRGHNTALGSAQGVTRLNISASSDFSSLKQFRGAFSGYDEAARFTNVVEVNMERLDSFVGDLEGSRLLIKIDTQGSDQDVLEGAEEALRKAVAVQIEMSPRPLYEGSWTMPDALRYLAARGFVPIQLHPACYYASDPSKALEFDGVFVSCLPNR